MILSDGEIWEAIEAGEIVISPRPAASQLETSALDLCLGEELMEWKPVGELWQLPRGAEPSLVIDAAHIDVKKLVDSCAREARKEADTAWVLKPGVLALAKTRERIELPREAKIAARVEGRSTLARLGLVVHLTAPVVHAGWRGRLTLEMYNFGSYPLKLVAGMPICQLVFERLGRKPRKAQPTTRYLE